MERVDGCGGASGGTVHVYVRVLRGVLDDCHDVVCRAFGLAHSDVVMMTLMLTEVEYKLFFLAILDIGTSHLSALKRVQYAIGLFLFCWSGVALRRHHNRLWCSVVRLGVRRSYFWLQRRQQ